MEASSASNSSPGTSDSAVNKTQPRHRNLWTKSEDEILLRGAAILLDQDGVTNAWSQIAASLPRRTNKDCRKRWMKICKKVNKGAWTSAEDMRLVKAVQQHGQCWTQVAKVVQTRHADQCAKRWQQSLDPSIVPARWCPRDDDTLLAAVKVHGHKWKTIADEYFSSRSTTDIKNRYSTLTKERTGKRNSDINHNASRDLSPEFDLESNDSLSDMEGCGTADNEDTTEVENMTNSDDKDMQIENYRPFTPTTTMELDTSIYSPAFDYSFLDNDPNFALTLTPPIDTDGAMEDGIPWNTPFLPPFEDGNAGHLAFLSSIPEDEECTMKLNEPGTPELSLRRPRSKTTLVLEDVDPVTLCKVIGVLAEAKTKISMQSGENDGLKF